MMILLATASLFVVLMWLFYRGVGSSPGVRVALVLAILALYALMNALNKGLQQPPSNAPPPKNSN